MISTSVITLRTRLPLVLRSPRAYPRDAMVLATIAVLFLLLLLILVFLALDQIAAVRKRAALGVKRNWGRLIGGLVWAIVIVGAVGLTLSVLPLVPSVGGVCGSCHATAVSVDTWETGGHSRVSCYACHASPGVFGAASASFVGVGRVLNIVRSSAASTAVGSLYSDRCLGCHGSVAEGLTGSGVIMRHSDVIAARMPCVVCHSAVGHERRGRSSVDGTPRQLMPICLTCHDGVRAPADCDVCHADHPLDTAMVVANPGSTAIKMTCDGCHKPAVQGKCIECHGLELPHPSGFMSKHAGLSADDPALCTRCHERASANSACACHSNGDLHGTYSEWFPRHGVMAAETGPMGCNCHQKAFCLICHSTPPFGP